MNAGRYKDQATIQYPVTTVNETTGVESVTWTPLLTEGSPPSPVRVWGELQDVLPSRAESVAQGLQVARNQARWRQPWIEGITTVMRIVIHDETDIVYQIVAGPAMVVGAGRRRELECVLERYSS